MTGNQLIIRPVFAVANSPMRVTDFEIVHVPVSPGTIQAPRGMPLYVVTLFDRDDFVRTKEVHHWVNGMIEDRGHDWDGDGTQLRYFTRTGGPRDVLLVYGVEESPAIRFDPQTGLPVARA